MNLVEGSMSPYQIGSTSLDLRGGGWGRLEGMGLRGWVEGGGLEEVGLSGGLKGLG